MRKIMGQEEPKESKKITQEKIAELLEKNQELHEKFNEMFKKTYLLHQKMESEIREVKKETTSLLAMLTKRLNEQKEAISKSISVSENSEETLLNVLLAIRQNEYLQAWYPEQHGFPEMNVIGSHPIKQLKTQ